MSQTELPSPNSPANEPAKSTVVKDRIPMSLPVPKLEVPEIPGFHCHWMRGDAQRIAQALRAGYTFVEEDEVELGRFGIAGSPTESGNQDLGSRVSVLAGTDEKGGAQSLYLMKLPLEYWNQDQAAAAKRQEAIAAQLRGDKGFAEAGMDASNRYVPPGAENRNIFLPKRRP